MGRYDRNRKKKPNKSAFFVMSLIMAMLIGMGGTYYALNNKKNLEPQTFAASEEKAVELEKPEPLPSVEQLQQNDSKLPPLPEIESAFNNSDAGKPIPPSNLPDLLSSDDLVRKSVAKLSPGIAQWLTSNQLIRRYIVIVNDFAQGIRVSKHVSFLRHEEPFSVLGDVNVLYMAPKSYRRYDSLVQAMQAIDAKAAVEVYRKFRPLMLQVFSEFSYPKDISLENIVSKAAGEILAAPVIEDPIELVRPSMFYKYADPDLEALGAVQKQMIRMGPENTRIIQTKCREFLVELAKK